jgi:RNA polymerase sigma-70 factor, ECF subfamily
MLRWLEGDPQQFRDNTVVDPQPSRAARSQPADVPAGTGDRELVADVLRKDRKAAAQFVAAHIDAVYAYARRRLMPRPELADDVVQDVFVAALDGLRTFTGASSLRAWLIGIARHKIEDLYRQRLRILDPIEESDESGAAPVAGDPPIDESIDAARVRAKTHDVLRQLPERYALLLFSRYWEQRSTRDIAAAIGATEKSVERMLARARARFKDLWAKGQPHD